MNKKVTGMILAAVGVIGGIAAYSLRPPSSFSEALMMAGQGRQIYLQQPVYLTALVISALCVAGGVGLIVKANHQTDES